MRPYLLIIIFAVALSPVGYAQTRHRPLCFIENNGQVHDQDGNARADIGYEVKCNGALTIFAGSGGLHYQFVQRPKNTAGRYKKDLCIDNDPIPTYRLDMELVGANPNAQAVAEGQQAYYENYHTTATCGQDVQVHSYSKITYKEIYPNIDWVLYMKDGRMEYDFVVRPGGNVSDIQIRYGGATDVAVNGDKVQVATPMGTITEGWLYSYEQDGGRQVAAKYVVGSNALTFNVGKHSGTLVIDPVLEWGTFFGGSNDEWSQGICTDKQGNAFIVGYTQSLDGIVTTGAHQQPYGGGNGDAYIAKFDSAGVIQWATYYGGEGDDLGFDISCDSPGNIYFAGSTASFTGVATSGAYQESFGGGDTYGDVLIAKFNSEGTLEWGTYYGGSGIDFGIAITCIGTGNVCICGNTSSLDSVATTNAYQTLCSGGEDAFLATFDTSGNLVWATYYGGNMGEYCEGITTDDSDNIYISGSTNSALGIATTNGYHTSFIGSGVNQDAFLVKFSVNGDIIWGTYYGGSGEEGVSDIAYDGMEGIVMTGVTFSTDNIATQGAYKITGDSGGEAYLSKFSTNGGLLWATYYGDGPYEEGLALACDKQGNIFFGGVTSNASGIATPGAYEDTRPYLGQNSYFVKFSNAGALRWGTYYGAGGQLYGICYHAGKLLITGNTVEASVIATPSAYQSTYGGGNYDAYLAKFDTTSPLAVPYVAQAAISISCSPNPAHNEITIATNAGAWSAGTAISAYSMGGQCMVKILPEGMPGATTINTAAWLPGIYLIVIQEGNGTLTREKVLVQK